jgi:hypothetical protein
MLPPARPESFDSLHTDKGVRVDTSTVDSVFGPSRFLIANPTNVIVGQTIFRSQAY